MCVRVPFRMVFVRFITFLCGVLGRGPTSWGLHRRPLSSETRLLERVQQSFGYTFHLLLDKQHPGRSTARVSFLAGASSGRGRFV